MVTGTLVYSDRGNFTDYFNLGASVDLVEHNFNHATLFFTSQMILNGTNITHINHVQLFRFIHNGQFYFSSLAVINDYRDRTNDTLGRLGLSVFNQSLLLTQEKQVPNLLLSLPLCTFT